MLLSLFGAYHGWNSMTRFIHFAELCLAFRNNPYPLSRILGFQHHFLHTTGRVGFPASGLVSQLSVETKYNVQGLNPSSMALVGNVSCVSTACGHTGRICFHTKEMTDFSLWGKKTYEWLPSRRLLLWWRLLSKIPMLKSTAIVFSVTFTGHIFLLHEGCCLNSFADVCPDSAWVACKLVVVPVLPHKENEILGCVKRSTVSKSQEIHCSLVAVPRVGQCKPDVYCHLVYYIQFRALPFKHDVDNKLQWVQKGVKMIRKTSSTRKDGRNSALVQKMWFQ